MEKNQLLEGTCLSLGSNGEGIVKADDITLFVPYLLPGERATIRVLKVKGNIAYGRVEELFTPAEERVRPTCSAFTRCGGCQLQHMDYRSQLSFKTKLVEDSLKKIGGLSVKVSPCIGSDKKFGYRNKLQLPIGKNNAGENVIGFYAERSHRIIPIEECPIHPAWSKPLIAALKRFMETCGVDGYSEADGSGELRHIVVRQLKKKFIVTLVSAKRQLRGIDFLLSLLDDVFGEYTFYLNYHPENTNVVFGKDFTLLKGEGVFRSEDCGILFEAGANTFLQVNEGVRTELYRHAVDLAVSDANEVVIDCYSGGGMLTAMFAKRCKHAYGIEIVPEAVACADSLKRINGLEDKITNFCGKVEDKLGDIMQKERDAVIVLDPPRSGADRSVLKAIMAQDVKKIVMISCNPSTLARDLGILTGMLVEKDRGELTKSADPSFGKYEILSVQPFDMFPQTKCVETLVSICRK